MHRWFVLQLTFSMIVSSKEISLVLLTGLFFWAQYHPLGGQSKKGICQRDLFYSEDVSWGKVEILYALYDGEDNGQYPASSIRPLGFSFGENQFMAV